MLGVNKEEQKISLGVRQLEPNPWDDIDSRYPIGSTDQGQGPQPHRLRCLHRTGGRHRRHGARLRPQLDPQGQPPVSEVLKKGDEVEATVIEIDKRTSASASGSSSSRTIRGAEIDSKFKVGDLVKGVVAKIATFGAFVQLEDEIDGLVHISQLSEEHVGKVKDVSTSATKVEARVIKVDKVERRIGLSIKAATYTEDQLKKETQAFEALRPSADLVGLEQAFSRATEEWRPGEEGTTPVEGEGE